MGFEGDLYYPVVRHAELSSGDPHSLYFISQGRPVGAMNRVSEPHDSLGDWENAVAIPNEKWNEFTLIRSYSPRLITKTRFIVDFNP